MVVYTCQCHTPNLSHLLSPASNVYKSVLYICISILALQIGLSVPEIPYICVNIYLFFSFWLASVCTTDAMFFHITPNDSVSFLLVTNVQLYICTACMLSRFSHVWLFVTLWTVAGEAPLSVQAAINRAFGWASEFFMCSGKVPCSRMLKAVFSNKWGYEFSFLVHAQQERHLQGHWYSLFVVLT